VLKAGRNSDAARLVRAYRLPLLRGKASRLNEFAGSLLRGDDAATRPLITSILSDEYNRANDGRPYHESGPHVALEIPQSTGRLAVLLIAASAPERVRVGRPVDSAKEGAADHRKPAPAAGQREALVGICASPVLEGGSHVRREHRAKSLAGYKPCENTRGWQLKFLNH